MTIPRTRSFEVRFLNSTGVAVELRKCFENSIRARIAVAYLSLDGWKELSEPVKRFLENKKELLIIVGISSYHITEWQALVALLELKEKSQTIDVKYYNNEGFHPKMFVFEFSGETWIIIGSSNLTGAGLDKNVEANLLLKTKNEKGDALENILSYWDCLWNGAEPLSNIEVRKYKSTFSEPTNHRNGTNAGLPRTPLPKTPLPDDFLFNSNENHTINSSYWKIAPGKQGRNWSEWKEAIHAGKGYVALGWRKLGNLKGLGFVSKSEFKEEIKRKVNLKYEGEDLNYVAGQFWRFCREMHRGDVVVAYSKKTIFGIGYVDGDYYFEERDARYPHRRTIKWITLLELRVQKKIWSPLATNNVINAIKNPSSISYLEKLIL